MDIKPNRKAQPLVRFFRVPRFPRFTFWFVLILVTIGKHVIVGVARGHRLMALTMLFLLVFRCGGQNSSR